MHKLAIDVGEIAEALSVKSDGEYYLDVETGRLVFIPQEWVGMEPEAPDLADRPDGEREIAIVARAINAGDPRYRLLPEATSEERYYDMADFADSVEDPGWRDRLMDALEGKGAFGRFRNLLAKAPPVHQQAWLSFRTEANQRRVRAWLAELGIEPTARPTASETP